MGTEDNIRPELLGVGLPCRVTVAVHTFHVQSQADQAGNTSTIQQISRRVILKGRHMSVHRTSREDS